MKTYEVTVLLTAPDNFDEDGVSMDVDAVLSEFPDFYNVEVVSVNCVND